MTSKPATQVATAPISSRGRGQPSREPVTATQAPPGARARATPKKRCALQEKRLKRLHLNHEKDS